MDNVIKEIIKEIPKGDVFPIINEITKCEDLDAVKACIEKHNIQITDEQKAALADILAGKVDEAEVKTMLNGALPVIVVPDVQALIAKLQA